ncbi:MAG: RDD family protein [Oligoflexia bacterium]|nr:RDD family protein [Oligoflexia bacterium]
METRYAGFWLRLVAHLLDNALLMLAAGLVGLVGLGAAYWLRARTESAFPPDPVWLQVGMTAIYATLSFFYYGFAHFRYGATLGKRLLGLRVCDANTLGNPSLGQAIVRYLAYGVSWFFVVGFLMAGLTSRKRALHDLIAGTIVIRVGRGVLPRAVTLGLVLGFAGAVILPDASEAAVYPQLGFALVSASPVPGSPSALGFEGQLAGLFSPSDSGAPQLGPRIGYFAVTGEGAERREFFAGAEGMFWLVNAIAPGFAFDVVGSGRLRGEAFLSARILRFRQEGAWALRFGPTYDDRYEWGLKLGVTLQLSGVPSLASRIE